MGTEQVFLPRSRQEARFLFTGQVIDDWQSYPTSPDRWIEQRPDRVRTRKPQGWLYPNPYTYHMEVIRFPSGHVENWTSDSHFVYSVVDGFLGTAETGSVKGQLSDASFNELRRRAEVKALLSLKDQKFNAAVALAEAQQTANLVGSTATRLARSYQALKGGQARKAARILGVNPRKAPDNWLELQYGWKPLLSDVYNSAEAVASAANKPDLWVKTVKATVQNNANESSVYNSGYANYSEMDSWLESVFVRFDAEPWSSFLTYVSQTGLSNPLEVAWEKVPFSFVVDWFLPVGDWLSTMDATVGYHFKSGSCSYLRRRLVTRQAGYGPSTKQNRWFQPYVERHVSLQRTIYNDFPTVMRPDFKNPLSLGHMANGLSLLAGAFGRR